MESLNKVASATRPNLNRGAALLIALLVLMIAVAAIFLGPLSWLGMRTEREEINAEVLARAKAALIGYAATFPEQNPASGSVLYVPGHLPCPDTASVCGSRGVSVIGLFPWQKLGLPVLKDADGNCLWYAVSGNFKASPKARLLNRDTLGQLIVYGDDGSTALTPANHAAAVIFSAGPPLPGQNRTHDGSDCGGDLTPDHFLDSHGGINNSVINNAVEALTSLISRNPDSGFNDRLIWITPDELFQKTAEKRSDFERALFDTDYAANGSPALAQRIAECIAAGFGSNNNYKRLPWAVPIALPDSPPDTFRNTKFADVSNQFVGRVPFIVSNSVTAIGASQFAPIPPATTTLSSCSGTNDSCRLLRTDNCPADWSKVAGYPTGTDSPDGWWDKWKDHYFYAVSPAFKPGTGTPDCAIEKCVELAGVKYAAIVIYSDRALAGQQRLSLTDRNSPANYLEEDNVLAFTNDTSNPNFGKFKHAGNDKFVCITTSLTVAPC